MCNPIGFAPRAAIAAVTFYCASGKREGPHDEVRRPAPVAAGGAGVVLEPKEVRS
jgi:hypothetical protein